MADAAADQAPSDPAAPPPPSEGGFLAGRRAAALAAIGGPSPGQPAAAPTPEPVVAPTPAAPVPTPEPQPDESLRKQEIHLKRQIAAEREKAQTEIAAERQALAAERAEYEQFKALRGNARADRLAAIRALGFSDADFASLGTELYAHSPEGQKDPRYKAQAELKIREREEFSKYDKELADTKREMAELKAWKQEQAQAAQQSQHQARIESYLDEVSSAVTDATPLAKVALTKDPQRTRAMLAQISEQLYVTSGPEDDLRDVPTAAQVLKEYDKRRAAELEMFGLDPAAIGKSAAPSVPPAPRPAATLAPNGAAPTQSQAKGRLPREQLIKEVARFDAQRNPSR